MRTKHELMRKMRVWELYWDRRERGLTFNLRELVDWMKRVGWGTL